MYATVPRSRVRPENILAAGAALSEFDRPEGFTNLDCQINGIQ